MVSLALVIHVVMKIYKIKISLKSLGWSRIIKPEISQG